MSTPDHIKDLHPDPENRRRHNPRNLGVIANSLQNVGAARSIVIDDTDVVLAGNGVLEAAAEVGITKVRVIEATGDEIIAVRRRGLTTEQKRHLAMADNRSSELAEWDAEQLALDEAAGLMLQPYFSDQELAAILGRSSAAAGDSRKLADRFLVVPFSVLNAREGWWQERKAAWLALGIESELGRGGGTWVESDATGSPLERREAIRAAGAAASPGGSPRPAATLGADGKTRRGDGRGRART